MIALVIGVACLVGLFGYLSHTNPVDPTWIESTLRTLTMFGGTLFVCLLVYLEIRFIDQKVIEYLATDIGGEDDN